MKSIFGIILIIVGIVAGIWAGLIWAFIGGIIDFVNAVKADDISGLAVGIAIIKILFASFIGWVSAIVFIVPGAALAKG